jgi:hypothetical protein
LMERRVEFRKQPGIAEHGLHSSLDHGMLKCCRTKAIVRGNNSNVLSSGT